MTLNSDYTLNRSLTGKTTHFRCFNPYLFPVSVFELHSSLMFLPRRFFRTQSRQLHHFNFFKVGLEYFLGAFSQSAGFVSRENCQWRCQRLVAALGPSQPVTSLPSASSATILPYTIFF